MQNITRKSFAQFALTPISLEVAEKLAGSWTRLLELTQDVSGFNAELLLLDTGAKLYWINQAEYIWGEKAMYSFGIGSYNHDGADGWNAYELALAELNDMSSVSFARRTETCVECRTMFKQGFIADRFENEFVVDMIYVCSVKCGLDSRQPW